MENPQELIKIDNSYLNILEKQVKEINESLKSQELHVTHINNIDPDEWDKMVIYTTHPSISRKYHHTDGRLLFKIDKEEILLDNAHVIISDGTEDHLRTEPTFEIEKIIK